MSKNNKNRKSPEAKQKAREARALREAQELQQAHTRGKVRLAVLCTAVISVLLMSSMVKILVMDGYVRSHGYQMPGILTVGLVAFIIVNIITQVLLWKLYFRWQFKPWAAKLIAVLMAVVLVFGIGMDLAWDSSYKKARDAMPPSVSDSAEPAAQS